MSLDEVSPSAEHCRRMWDIVRDDMLRQRHWNFALARAELSEVSPPPAFGYLHAYELPSDYILGIELNGQPLGTGQTECDLEGSTILCNAITAQIRYVKRVVSVQSWDPSFCKAFALALAAAIAPALTTATGVAQSLRQESAQLMAVAYGPDNLETRPRAISAMSDSAWLKAREGPF